MSIIDLLIGLTLVNALPHFVLGIWKGRMLSGLGFGNRNNVWYGIINLIISLTLFIYSYGIGGLIQNGIYAGGILVVVLYMLLAPTLYRKFNPVSTSDA